MSAAFDTQSSKEANDKQRQKYPDFSEEMRRRGAMTQNRRSGANEGNYGGKEGLSKEMARRAKIRWEKYGKKPKIKSRKQVRTEEQDLIDGKEFSEV